MLRVNQIKNVSYTLKQPTFKSGVQYNAPYVRKVNIVEDGFFTVFTSKIKDMFSPEAKARAQSIESGLNPESRYFHTVV